MSQGFTNGNIGAPIDATYIVQTSNSTLTGEQVLASLATGIVKNTTTTGVLSIAIEGTDYYGPGGTDVAITDGGTGQSTAQTAIDALTQVSAATNEYVLTKDTATGNALWKAAVGGASNYNNWKHVCQGRLTLTSGIPVTTSDVTAATTIYFIPYNGNNIAIYNTTNTEWDNLTFIETSISVPSTTNQMYDIWAYNNAGTLALELLAWTNDTTRATALNVQDRVYVKNGDASRRYIGSFRTTGVSGQTEDSVSKRYLWNYYNRKNRKLLYSDTTLHAYNSATIRYWNNNSAVRVEFVCGGIEDSFQAGYWANLQQASGSQPRLGLGLNTNTAYSSEKIGLGNISSGVTMYGNTYTDFPSVGFNYLAILESVVVSSGSPFYQETSVNMNYLA